MVLLHGCLYIFLALFFGGGGGGSNMQLGILLTNVCLFLF